MRNTIIVQRGAVVNVVFPTPATSAQFGSAVPRPKKQAKKAVPEIQKVETHKAFAVEVQRQLAAMFAAAKEPEKAYRILTCGDMLTFQAWDNEERTKNLQNANFCKHPLCPLCCWRRSIQLTQRMAKAAEFLQQENPAKHLYHLSLTVRNTPDISAAAIRALKQNAVSLIRNNYTTDYLIGLEITFSAETGFHPHIHALLLTEKPLGTSYKSIKALRAKWGALFGEEWLMAKLLPVTDISAAAAEVAKYIVKYSSLELPPEKLSQLAAAIKGQRKLQPAGAWQKAIKAAKAALKDEKAKEINALSTYNTWLEFYAWSAGGYLLERWAAAESRQGREAPPTAVYP